jgi:D-glycerate 3-kinase
VAQALSTQHGLSLVVLSLDDFYLRKEEREQLARDIHPLCATRGVPGTHDVDLMRQTLQGLRAAHAQSLTRLPRFDKLADDREQPAAWGEFAGRPDLILLEGWCVGVREADLEPWRGPINPLERNEDPNGEWFAWSRAALPLYESIWSMFSLLVSIEVPDWQTVIDSRLRQEHGLTSASGRQPMDRAGVERFVQHYERYTRAMWTAMPRNADVLLRRDRDFGFTLAG